MPAAAKSVARKTAGKAAPKRKAATHRRPAVVKDVCPQRFIKALASSFKKSGKFVVPEIMAYIKTGASRELAPQEEDWFFTRLAAVARRVYIRPGVGIGSLRKVFGQANYRNHVSESHASLAAGGNIRVALQLLEKQGLVRIQKEGGREITAAGQKELDLVAQAILMGDAETA